MLKIFKYHAPVFAAILLLACAGGSERSPEMGNAPGNQPILNLRLQNTVGPSLGEGTSLIDPVAIAINDIGEIYISDKARNTIYKLSSSLDLISGEGGIGVGAGSFNRPLGMAFDAALNIYVADSGNRRIAVLDRNLHFVRSYTTFTDANEESIDFESPGDISLDREGNIWIADENRVLKLNPFFDQLLEISNDSPGYPIVGEIISLRVSRSGLVAIADRGSRQIVTVKTAGTYIGKFPVKSPLAVAWDINNNIWIADSGKIYVYDLYGNQKFEFAGDEAGSRIIWLAFDNTGRLYALDAGLRRIKVYDIIPGAATTGSN